MNYIIVQCLRKRADKHMNIDLDKEKIIHGKALWDSISNEYEIDGSTVSLVLSGENKILDKYALELLPAFVERKKAQKAVIFIAKESRLDLEWIGNNRYPFPACVVVEDIERLRLIYDYYCFAFNLDNMTFTFLNHCHYNLMGRILQETDITEEEAVSLGVYWLRELPEKNSNV